MYVNNTQITISTVGNGTVAWARGNADFLVEFTITDNVLTVDNHLFKPITKKFAAGSKGSIGIQSLNAQKNIIIDGNFVTNNMYAFVKQGGNADASYTEIVSNNTFINSQQSEILHLNYAPGIKYVNNTIPSDNTTIVEAMFEKGNVTLKDLLTIKFGKSQELPNANPNAVPFFSGSSKRVKAVSITATSGTTAGKLIVTINGQSFTSPTNGAQAIIATNVDISLGMNTVKVTDTVGDLVYSDVYMTLKTL